MQLRRLIEERYGFPSALSHLLQGNDYDLALRTGAYFPGRPQLRPLPFNDEQFTAEDFRSIPICSKDFSQLQKAFTPGAITFCWSCAEPKILGFKVLYGNERHKGNT